MNYKATTLIGFLFIFLMSVVSFSAQPAVHESFSYWTVQQLKKQTDIPDWATYPLGGIASHMAADRLIGESKIEYQLDIAGVRTLIMWWNTPEEQRGDFLLCAFWGLFPDIVDKCFGTSIFHGAWQGSPIVPMSSGATDLLEEIAVFSYTVRW